MGKATPVLAALALCWASFAAPPAARAAESEGTFWTGYMSTWWFDPSWGIWFDTHYNVDAFFLLRGGLSRRFERGITATAGYAWLLLNPDFERQEHRGWFQVFFPWRINDQWSLSGRFRTDFRFLESVRGGEIVSGFDTRIRPRWSTTLTRRFQPWDLGQPFVSLGHEILVDAYADPGRDVVDQNRVSLLFGLELKHVTVRLGYMNRYLPNGDGRVEHAAILWFTQSVDLSKRRRLLRRRPDPEPDPENFPEFGGP